MSREVKARKRAIEKEKQRKKRQWRIIGGVLGVLVLAAALFTVFSQSGNDGETAAGLRTAAEVGALAPDFELASKDGELMRLSDYRGQPVAVTFMHTW